MAGIRPNVRWLLRLALRRDDLARADVDHEIAFHIEQRVKALVAEGMEPAAARAEALLRFGDLETARERLSRAAIDNERTLALRERMEAGMDDLRYVLRSLARSPAFSAAVILTLGLGIGANAAMAGIIDRLLLSGPKHVAEPDRLVRLYHTSVNADGATNTWGAWSFAMYDALRANARTLTGVAATSPAPRVAGAGADAERVEGSLATHDFFPLLGVRPAVGRFFGAEEDRAPGQRVVVIGYELWQRRFNGDSSAVGKTLRLDGDVFTIVGVAPRGFTGVTLRRSDIWIPMALTDWKAEWRTSWSSNWLLLVARLKPGVAAPVAAAEAQQIFRRNAEGASRSMQTATLSFLPLGLTTAAKEATDTTVSRWLAGVSIVVLLIACANATNLLVARVARRRREVAVRLALGVERWRLARLILSESVTLALLGCVVGLVCARWGGSLIRTVLLPNVLWDSTPVDARVLAYSIGVALLVGILVGIAPVLQARHMDLTASLKAGSQQSGSSRAFMRQSLVFLQAAFSVVLLVGAGLFVRSLRLASELDLGFEPDKVLQAELEWPDMRSGTPQWVAERNRQRAVLLDVSRKLSATPGVQAAAIAVGTPFGGAFQVRLSVPGYDTIPKLEGGGPFISSVQPGYFEATGMRLLRGRAFNAGDGASSERVTIVNEPMARALWPGQDPLARCLQIFDTKRPCARVVGIVRESSRFGLREEHAMQYFIPYGQEAENFNATIMVRPTGDPRRFAETVRRVILEADPTLLTTRVQLMQDSVDPLKRSWKLGATLFTIFGAIALVIAAMGLYSVVAYLVAQRTQEFGVRMALGAQTPDIVGLVVRGGLTTVAAGIVVGLIVALLAGRFVAPLLFDTSPRDVGVITEAAAVLFSAALVACWLPAYRASRVDAAVALRSE
jgi:predicted permease